MKKPSYILTLSCPDIPGIVATVSDYLFKQGGFILESAQFGDFATNRFFMRVDFECEKSHAELTSSFFEISQKFAMEWNLFDKATKPKILIAVSKAGHCLNHLLYKHENGALPVEIVGVFSNHEDLRVMAERHGLKFFHHPISSETKAQQEQQLLNLIKNYNVDLLVLARYMQVLSDDMSKKMSGRAINIHHSFLPGF